MEPYFTYDKHLKNKIKPEILKKKKIRKTQSNIQENTEQTDKTDREIISNKKVILERKQKKKHFDELSLKLDELKNSKKIVKTIQIG